jgi:hypothetical protein
MRSLDKLIRYQNFLIDQAKNKLSTIECHIQNAHNTCLSLKDSLNQEIHQSFFCVGTAQTFQSYYEYLQQKIKILQDKKEDLIKEKMVTTQCLKNHIFTLKRYEKIMDIQDEKELEELQKKERRI